MDDDAAKMLFECVARSLTTGLITQHILVEYIKRQVGEEQTLEIQLAAKEAATTEMEVLLSRLGIDSSAT